MGTNEKAAEVPAVFDGSVESDRLVLERLWRQFDFQDKSLSTMQTKTAAVMVGANGLVGLIGAALARDVGWAVGLLLIGCLLLAAWQVGQAVKVLLPLDWSFPGRLDADNLWRSCQRKDIRSCASQCVVDLIGAIKANEKANTQVAGQIRRLFVATVCQFILLAVALAVSAFTGETKAPPAAAVSNAGQGLHCAYSSEYTRHGSNV